MPKVYIVNPGSFDYTDAERFGALVYLTDSRVDQFQFHHILSGFAEKLKEAEPDDYLVMAGLSSLCVAAAAILVYKFGRLNLLMFNGESRRYTARECNLENLLG